MRDTVTAPGLSGEASGCGGGGRHNRGCEGGAVGARRAAAGPAGASGIPVQDSDSAFPVPLVDAELVEHFADVPPRLLGSSSVVVALDWACPSSVDLLRPREAIETPTR